MAALYGSPLRITWNPGANQVVLVDYGDDLSSLIQINGQTVVQASQVIRASSVTNYDRGNRTTKLHVAKVIECATLQDALAVSFGAVTSLPTGSAPVLVEVDGAGQSWTIPSCVINSWDGGINPQSERFAIVGYGIQGGRMIGNS